jgi:tannase/feruloyl esterase
LENNKMKAFSCILVLVAAAATALAMPARAADDRACAALAHFKMAKVHVDTAGPMEPKDKVDPGLSVVPQFPVGASFCRVQATLTPTADSSIRIEVWLPAAKDWNGRFLASGNGGFAGNFLGPYLSMRDSVARGYAAAGTDTGHVGDPKAGWHQGADWALGHPEKIKDFGYRAEHLTAQTAKAIVRAYYRHPARHAYFAGCSDGGREALMEAQRFPADYDGIIAGAPAYAWTGLVTAFAWDARARLELPDQTIPPAKLAVLQAAALKKCDALDGVEDGVIDDPRRCDFDPATVQCANGDGDGDDCLSAAEVAAVRKIYQGPVNPGTGASIYAGLPPGDESVQWNQWVTGKDPDGTYFATQYFRNMVYGKADWTLDQIDFAHASADAEAKTGADLTADNPDLSAFIKHGGKLILYHGWADGAIPPQGTIQYYENVRARLGAKADGAVRLYMVPGMAHCLGGPGPNSFDMQPGIEQWVESGNPPQSVPAAKYANDLAKLLGMPLGEPTRTRPLCPYPQVAHWQGSGSTDDAANFSCGAE